MPTPVIEAATFRLAPQCLNQLQHQVHPIVLFDSYFCRNESLRLNSSWKWTFCILQSCDSDLSLCSTIKTPTANCRLNLLL